MSEQTGVKSDDIGWKKFAVSVVDLLRWPAAFLIVAFFIKEPIGKLVEAMASALQN
jgi:hypothetical protein